MVSFLESVNGCNNKDSHNSNEDVNDDDYDDRNKGKKKKKQKSDGSDRKNPEVLIPPLQANSPQEIASFDALDLALRSHPELAREGANILNPKALARLVEGIRSFQNVHLGRGATGIKNGKEWPIVRLPDEILRCRSKNGPLFTLILAAYRQKKESSWRQFDFTSPKRYDDNILLLQRMERDLLDSGHLKRPVVYFDETVPDHLRNDLRKTVLKYGGRVVDHPPRANTNHHQYKDQHTDRHQNQHEDEDEHQSMDHDKRKRKRKRKHKHKHAKRKQHDTEIDDSNTEHHQRHESTPDHKVDSSSDDNEPTHVVAWDGEEHDCPENIEDDSNIRSGVSELEKLYLRTITVVDPRAKKNTVGGGIVESTVPDSKKKGGKLGGKGSGGKRALVPLEDPMALVHWWYWPSSYDEWMLACDVAGEQESHPPARPKGGAWVVGCKFIRDVENFNEWGLEADYAIVDYARKVTYYTKLEEKQKAEAKLAKKEARNFITEGSKQHSAKDPELNTKDKISSSNMHSSATSQGKGTKTGSGKAFVKGDRRPGSGEGINPRQIHTGFYSENGSRMRRTVYDGALRIPSDASTLMHHAIDRLYQNNGMSDAGINVEKLHNSNTNIPVRNSSVLLPSIDSVLRPSEDPLLASNFIVTELRAGASGVTIALNRHITCIPSPPVIPITAIGMQGEMYRIRGGGGEADRLPVSDGGQFDDADGGKEGEEDGNKVVYPSVHATNHAAATAVDKVASTEEKIEGMKTPGINSIINIGGGTIPLAVPAADITGGENKTSSLHMMIEQHKLNIKTENLTQGRETHAEPTRNISHIASIENSANNLTNQMDVTMQVQPNKIISSTQAGNTLPTAAPSGSTVMKGNLLPSKATEPSSSSASSMLKTVPSISAAVNPPTVITEKKPSAVSGFQSTLSKQDGTKTKDLLPILAPLREKSYISASYKTGGKSNAKIGTTLTGDQEPTVASPRWYNSKRISDFERSILPEWFNQSAIHRTPSSYLLSRERIIDVARESGTKYVNSTAKKYLTSTAIRRCVPGDAGSLLRLHQFLVNWGFINGSAIGDLAPTGLNLTKEKETNQKISEFTADGYAGGRDAFVRSGFWSQAREKVLTNSVVALSSRKRKHDEQHEDETTVDWKAVAQEVGNGVTSIECQRRFLSITFSDGDCSKLSDVSQDRSNVINESGTDNKPILTRNKIELRKEHIFHELIDNIRPEVVQAATDAALRVAGSDIAQGQKASLLSIISVSGLARAKEEEEATEKILQEILNQRMAKLENRLSLLEDAEGILDSERIALELERRDLYTARCRHWFAGDT